MHFRQAGIFKIGSIFLDKIQFHCNVNLSFDFCLLQYVSTVIPFHGDGRPLDIATLQSQIKILKAVNEDSPNVPSLLTDYILNGMVPALLYTTSYQTCQLIDVILTDQKVTAQSD